MEYSVGPERTWGTQKTTRNATVGHSRNSDNTENSQTEALSRCDPYTRHTCSKAHCRKSGMNLGKCGLCSTLRPHIELYFRSLRQACGTFRDREGKNHPVPLTTRNLRNETPPQGRSKFTHTGNTLCAEHVTENYTIWLVTPNLQRETLSLRKTSLESMIPGYTQNGWWYRVACHNATDWPPRTKRRVPKRFCFVSASSYTKQYFV